MHSPTVMLEGVMKKKLDIEALVDKKFAHNMKEAEELLVEFLDQFKFSISMKKTDSISINRAPVPQHPFSYVAVNAKHDRYVPTHSPQVLINHFSKAKDKGHIELKWIDGGHTYSFLFGNQEFVAGIVKSFQLLKLKLSS